MEAVGAVLVIEDDADVSHAARLALASHVQGVETSVTPVGLESLLVPRRFEVVLLDMNFAVTDRHGREGLDALERIRQADATLAVVLMTAFGGVALAVEALKRGAADFILKPWRNDKLVEVVLAAVAGTRSRRAGEVLDLNALERNAIVRALSHYGGNVSQAASALGLTRPALYRRMSKYGLQAL